MISYGVDSVHFYWDNLYQLKTELLLGLAVSIMMVPESIAFAFTAGLSPVQGLQSTFFIGIFAAAFGGRPGTVSGLAGAIAIIQRDLIIPQPGQNALASACMSDRLHVLFATMFAVGVTQIVLGVLGATKMLGFIPHPVRLGFANGLSLVMGLAQLNAFKVPDTDALPNSSRVLAEPEGCPRTETPIRPPQRWLMPWESELWLILGLVTLAMLIMTLQPKIRKTLTIGPFTVTSKIIPATLTAMIATTLVEHLVYRGVLGVRTATVGDIALLRGSTLGWPTTLPILPLTSPYWGLMLKYAVTLCAVGSLESVVTMELCAAQAHQPATAADGVRELVAQGVGNMVASTFATAGGSAMVGQSILNIQSGARGRLASMTASLWILSYVIVAGRAIEMLPIASLTGILMVVVIRTIEWGNLWDIFVRRTVPWKDGVTVVLVSLLSVAQDLGVAVLVGVVWSAVGYAWDAGNELKIHSENEQRVVVLTSNGRTAQAQVISLHGPVFFASSVQLERALDPPHTMHSNANLQRDEIDLVNESTHQIESQPSPPWLLLDVTCSRIHDFSAAIAIRDSARKWHDIGGGLLVTGANEDSLRLLHMVGSKAVTVTGEKQRGLVWFPQPAAAAMPPERATLAPGPFKANNSRMPEKQPSSNPRSTAMIHPHAEMEMVSSTSGAKYQRLEPEFELGDDDDDG
ncbi:sulfate transporter family-domain-containing protein [Catenaria anguillulae PL171]|uniref:Sulfate transporter family-domain-containing protein n=1 Tax=Catenaria anguillulae PL171 TaxID=765915 RepID=A0A1Y2HME8_9FUNG|nr:sulfate transporter family-domain-containing protein [Catenaria anguillulae PL171]